MKLLFMYILFVKEERTQSIAQNSNPLKHYTQSNVTNTGRTVTAWNTEPLRS